SMRNCGVCTDFVTYDDSCNTALAIVTLSDDGDRQFSFYRNQTADVMLDKSEIKVEMFERGDILHFCSVGLVESPSKYAHLEAIDFAKYPGALVSFDVNV
ncbi:MAG: PfkB family carbohydrate kinase, partial [Clostridia bacterium]